MTTTRLEGGALAPRRMAMAGRRRRPRLPRSPRALDPWYARTPKASLAEVLLDVWMESEGLDGAAGDLDSESQRAFEAEVQRRAQVLGGRPTS